MQKIKYYNSDYQGLGHASHLIYQIIASQHNILPYAEKHVVVFEALKTDNRVPFAIYSLLKEFADLVLFLNPYEYKAFTRIHDFTALTECPIGYESDKFSSKTLLFQSLILEKIMNEYEDTYLRRVNKTVKRSDEEIFSFYGIEPGSKVAVIHIRDTHWASTIRDCTAYNYIQGIQYLINKGYHVVRIGYSTNSLRLYLPENYTENINIFSNQLDLALINISDFFVGCESGPAILPGLFRKKALLTNIADAALCLGVYNFPNYQLLFRPQERENTPEEILHAIQICESSYSFPSLSPLQNKYKKLLEKNHGYKSSHNLISPVSFNSLEWSNQFTTEECFTSN